MNNIDNARRGLLEKSLKQVFRYSDGVYNRGQWMERHCIGVESAEVAAIEYNRAKYNRMNAVQQEKYEESLKRMKIEYRAYMNDGSFITIPKIVHDHYSGVTKNGVA